jgi:hypothetical protein
MTKRCFYVSWVDLRTDPWPQWERLQPSDDTTVVDIGGKRVRFLPGDHPEWPGVPVLDQAEAAVMAHPSMGSIIWPGIPTRIDGKPCRLYVGPTLSALFHPGSDFCNLNKLEAAYLLYQPERNDSPQERLRQAALKICKARGLKNFSEFFKREQIQFVKIAGITDPTDHGAIINAIEKQWLNHADPFGLKKRNAAETDTRVVVNLSPGTPSMHASWLMLRWNGALGGANCMVEFVQGDGGLAEKDAAEGPPPNPLRTVPIDVLSQFCNVRIGGPSQLIGQETTADEKPALPEVDLEKLGPPFDDLRRRIEHAALLGLPILLQGERGTGKTFLAHYYHKRRQFYRSQQAAGRPLDEAAPLLKGKKAPEKVVERFPNKSGDSTFVTVTLSEFGDLDNLRDTLFGWVKGAFTDSIENFDGLLGEAHGGTLFLDEIHHLGRPLQSALLGPLNNKRYRPKMAKFEIISHFDLVVATNDPEWRKKLAEDFRDRIERIVLEVPSFRSFDRRVDEIIWQFWEFTIRRRCQECNLEYAFNENDRGWSDCREELMGLFKRNPLFGNWRDLQRLADNLLLHLTEPRDGRPSQIRWDKDKLEMAIRETFSEF